MAWTAPRTWTTGELVTAALMNTHVRDNLSHLGGSTGASLDQDRNGFTNTSFADLDALTTQPFSSPVAVTVTTGTTALIVISAHIIAQNTSGTCRLGYRVSGASTVAAADSHAAISSDAGSNLSATFAVVKTGLTAGSNVFELQARTSANSGRIFHPALTVIPLTT